MALVGVGCLEFSFTYNNLALTISWKVIAAIVLIGTKVIAPRVTSAARVTPGALGCPLFNLPQATTTFSARLPPVLIALGLLLTGSVATMQIQSPLFDTNTIVGTFLCGLAITGLGVTARRRRPDLFVQALKLLAVGSALIAFGDTGWAFTIGTGILAPAASLTTAAGCGLYALSARDLIRLVALPPERRGTQLRRHRRAA